MIAGVRAADAEYEPASARSIARIAAAVEYARVSQAFGFKNGDAMVRAAAMRCQIW